MPEVLRKIPRSCSDGKAVESWQNQRLFKRPGSFGEQRIYWEKNAAGICGLLLGGLGVHKFFLGLNNAGFIMLAVSVGGLFLTPCLIFPFFGPMIMWLVGLIEGIIYLTKPDDEFYQTYAIEKKEWF